MRKVLFLLEYPRKGIWAVGFATKENKGIIKDKSKEDINKCFCTNDTKSNKWFSINVT